MRDKFSKPFEVSVDDIKLDIQNFRYYGKLSSQRDCIEAMLADSRAYLFIVAKDIAENGLTPNPIVLSKDDKGDWVVREGNRRITALKLLNNPSILRDKAKEKKFRAISKQFKNQIPHTIECISCDDEDCILEYLDRNHQGARNGTGRIDWNPENKSHFDMHMGKPAENALAIKVKEMVVKDGAKLKEPYYITNLQRIVQNKAIQGLLNYSWDGENLWSETEKTTLLKVFREIAQRVSSLTSRDLNKVGDQKAFVKKIIDDLGIKISDSKTSTYAVGKAETTAKETSKAAGRSTPSKPSWDRPRLIRNRNTNLSIPDKVSNRKARNVLHELSRKIDVRKSPIAASVMLRVLIEMSIERYMKKNHMTVKNSLKTNTRSVADHMQKADLIKKDYKNEIIQITNDQSLLSITSLQRFVHSFDLSPDRQVLCNLWDIIDLFIAECWK